MAYVTRKRVNKKRTATKRTVRKPTKALKRAIVRTLYSKCETKHYQMAGENLQLYHNYGNTGAYALAANPYPILTNPCSLGLGTSTYSRVGDKVQSLGVDIKLWISNKADRPNVMYRIIVVGYPLVDPASNTTFTGVNQNLFENGGITANTMLAPIDKQNFNVKYDRIIQPIAQSGEAATQKEHSKYVHMYIKTTGMLTYLNNAGATTGIPKAQRQRLAVYVLPYDAWGTLIIDNIASCAYQVRHYFKDM